MKFCGPLRQEHRNASAPKIIYIFSRTDFCIPITISLTSTGRIAKFETGAFYFTYNYYVVCIVIPFILDVRLVDVPAGVTQEEGRSGFLHFPSAVLALTFIARRIQPSLYLFEREAELAVSTN